MSEPTYRIVIRHTPEYRTIPYRAIVYRVTDDMQVFAADGATRDEAIKRAQNAISVMGTTKLDETLYADEHGGLVVVDP